MAAVVIAGAVLVTGAVVAAVALPAAGGGAQAATSGLIPVSTTSATRVLDSMGINVHENYVDTTYAPGGDTTALVRAVRASGVGWIRIGLKKHPFAYERSFLDQMHASGIKVLGIAGAPSSTWDDFQTGESRQLVAALRSGVYAGRIDMLEMPNEYDIGRADWTTKVTAFAREYFRALRADPVTRSIPVVGPSVGAESSCSGLAKAAPYADFFNVHSYSGTRVPEYPVAANCQKLAVAAGLPADQPVVSTEFGWNTSPKDPNQGLPASTVASYLPRAYLWNAMHGITRSFAYELFDQRPDPGYTDPQMHFGLIGVAAKGTDRVQTPKPAFASLQRLTALLRDRSTTGSRSIAVRWAAGASAVDAQVLQIKRSDGSVDVAIWLPVDAKSTRTGFVTLQMNADPRVLAATDVVSGATRSSAVNGQRVTVKASSSMVVLRIAAR